MGNPIGFLLSFLYSLTSEQQNFRVGLMRFILVLLCCGSFFFDAKNAAESDVESCGNFFLVFIRICFQSNEEAFFISFVDFLLLSRYERGKSMIAWRQRINQNH